MKLVLDGKVLASRQDSLSQRFQRHKHFASYFSCRVLSTLRMESPRNKQIVVPETVLPTFLIAMLSKEYVKD